MLKDRGAKIHQVVESTKKREMCPMELKLMDNFTKGSHLYLSEEGRHIKNRIKLAVLFYNSTSSDDEAVVITTSSDYIPGVDTFLHSFIKNYTMNAEFRDSLMLNLLRGYVLKVDGVKNQKYGTNML